jgi:hypothetical protein
MQNQNKVTIDGAYLKAFLVAYEEHKRLKFLAAHKKRIENYKLEFSQDKQYYYVRFLPKFAPKEEPYLGFETSLGLQITHVVRKKDFTFVPPR